MNRVRFCIMKQSNSIHCTPAHPDVAVVTFTFALRYVLNIEEIRSKIISV